MKRWIVTTIPMNTEVTVTADYFRVIDGALWFRNIAVANAYPEMVHVFARGQWLEVEPAPPEQVA